MNKFDRIRDIVFGLVPIFFGIVIMLYIIIGLTALKIVIDPEFPEKVSKTIKNIDQIDAISGPDYSNQYIIDTLKN